MIKIVLLLFLYMPYDGTISLTVHNYCDSLLFNTSSVYVPKYNADNKLATPFNYNDVTFLMNYNPKLELRLLEEETVILPSVSIY